MTLRIAGCSRERSADLHFECQLRLDLKYRVLVALDADEELAEDGGESEGEERDAYGGDGGPEQGGVPLPEPELADELDGVLAGGVEELVCG